MENWKTVQSRGWIVAESYWLYCEIATGRYVKQAPVKTDVTMSIARGWKIDVTAKNDNDATDRIRLIYLCYRLQVK